MEFEKIMPETDWQRNYKSVSEIEDEKLTIQQIVLQQAKNNRIKVQSVSLPLRMTAPSSFNTDINDWFNALPVPYDYPLQAIPASYLLGLDNQRIF
jgi:hypothetical protein